MPLKKSCSRSALVTALVTVHAMSFAAEPVVGLITKTDTNPTSPR